MNTELMPLLAFTILSGLSSGMIAMGFIYRFTTKPDTDTAALDTTSGVNNKVTPVPFFAYVVTALLLLGVGLIATLLHLGQPLRFLNGLSNPASMISQESYWSIAFGLLLLTCAIVAYVKRNLPLMLHALSALVGIGLIVVTSLAYFRAIGIPAWSGAITIPLFFFSDLLMGAALSALFFADKTAQAPVAKMILGLIVAEVITVTAFCLHLVDVAGQNQVVMLTIALVLGTVVPALFAGAQLKRKIDAHISRYIMFVCIALGVLLVRFSFFMSGIHL
jgi:DMSO reductase anchor subunit